MTPKKVIKKTPKKSTAVALPLSAEDKIWRAQDDARTLAVAEEIKKDQPRLNSAKTQAKKWSVIRPNL